MLRPAFMKERMGYEAEYRYFGRREDSRENGGHRGGHAGRWRAGAGRGLARAPRLQAFAAAHGVPRAYGSYEAMLADKDIHLVYIATPHSHHAAHTELCLAAGRHVLCEKAFTVNEAQARRVTAMAREKGLLLAEAHLDALYALAPAYLRHY